MSDEKKIKALGDEALDAVADGYTADGEKYNFMCPYCNKPEMGLLLAQTSLFIDRRMIPFYMLRCKAGREFYCSRNRRLLLDNNRKPIEGKNFCLQK
jgi:hypothetical protein